MTVVQKQFRLILQGAGGQGVATLRHQQIFLPIAVSIEEQHRPVVDRPHRQQRRCVGTGKLARRRTPQKVGPALGRPSHSHNLPSVAAVVAHRDPRTPAVEAGGQQPLHRDLVDRLFARAQFQTGSLAHLDILDGEHGLGGRFR